MDDSRTEKGLGIGGDCVTQGYRKDKGQGSFFVMVGTYKKSKIKMSPMMKATIHTRTHSHTTYTPKSLDNYHASTGPPNEVLISTWSPALLTTTNGSKIFTEADAIESTKTEREQR